MYTRPTLAQQDKPRNALIDAFGMCDLGAVGFVCIFLFICSLLLR